MSENKTERWGAILAKGNSKEWQAGIQWKGSEVCLDLHCNCGAHLHFDDDFLYTAGCVHCGRVYVLDHKITVTELSAEDAKWVRDEGSCFHDGEDQDLARARTEKA